MAPTKLGAGGRIATFHQAGNSKSVNLNVTSVVQNSSTGVNSMTQASAQEKISNTTLPNTRSRARQIRSV